MPVLPGIATATELNQALALGLRVVKLFPAEPLGGAALIAALAAPFPEARFVPTGGLGTHNAAEYLRLPSVLAIGGSWMVAPKLVAAGDWDAVTPFDGGGDRAGGCDVKYDVVALGEVMLRLDPGEGRIRNARTFRIWEGGGEYNVARGLRRCFGLRATAVTALVDNEIGRLVEDCMLQGGVDTSHVLWQPFDGTGRALRNGLNFTERGFGVRGAVGVSDRGHTAAAALRAGDVDWHRLFAVDGARWFHTGGVFAALSETTPGVIAEAIDAARAAGTTVSYDLNYRPSLWKALGGFEAARAVNRELAAQGRRADRQRGRLHRMPRARGRGCRREA